MSTDVQLQANRANAQFSTGPRTDEGKAASAQNARKHGLTSRQLTVPPEHQQEFDALLAGYQTEINPRGAIQQTLFDELVAAAWNLRRIRILESQLDLLDPQFDRIARHKTRIERTFHRSLKELKALQTEAALHHLLPRESRHRTPFLASSSAVQNALAKRTHPPSRSSPQPAPEIAKQAA